MLLHINPTRQRGKRTGSLAGASGWYMTLCCCILTRRASEGNAPDPSLRASGWYMTFFAAGVI